MGGDIDLIKFVAALLALLNPLASLPVFTAMAEGRTAAERRRMALVAALVVATALAVTAALGRHILEVFAITIDDLRVAGGLVVLFVALDMLRARPSEIQAMPVPAAPAPSGAAAVDGPAPTPPRADDPAIVPLGIPLLAGPGTIATVIVFADGAGGWRGAAVLAAGILLAALVVYAALRLADGSRRLLGSNGMNVLTRVMGLLLAAIAVGMILTGLRNALPGLAGAG